MSFIPAEELRRQEHVNLAPMVDFLFLILAVFATLAITRAAFYDTEMNLVKLASKGQEDTPVFSSDDPYLIHLRLTENGEYLWMTDHNEYLMPEIYAIQQELLKQVELGTFPREKTKVLLHIDKNATWEPIAKLIFAVRETSFSIHPVCESALHQ